MKCFTEYCSLPTCLGYYAQYLRLKNTDSATITFLEVYPDTSNVSWDTLDWSIKMGSQQYQEFIW